jgi:pimeloyl-ACP methyl ester carboxylesterase
VNTLERVRMPLLVALWSLLLAACSNLGDRRQPIPVQTVLAGESMGQTLVVVLPGRRDNSQVLARTGIAEGIQAAWPAADVMLTGATIAYYTDGGLAARLHEQLIVPARAAGYTEIWMMGASMGGMGTLMYERSYPGELDGMVLLAPFLGERGVLREIERAGGIAQWQPGPEPDVVDRSNFSRELWRHLQTWLDRPEAGRRTWLAYGDRDRLRDAVTIIAPLIPDTQILERSGGHTWKVWVPAAQAVLEAVRTPADTASSAACRPLAPAPASGETDAHGDGQHHQGQCAEPQHEG